MNMSTKLSPTPEGYRSVTPSFTFKDSAKAIEFYQAAFGAKVIDCLRSPDGRCTMHATMKIGDSILMMGDEMPGSDCGKSAETLGGSPISLYVYVADVDSAFDKAVSAGAKAAMPVADMFWGDRCGSLIDPFGYSWMIATHVKDLTNDQIQEGAKAFFAACGK
jgi:PhnB protein